MTALEKVKQKIKQINKNNTLYKVCLWILVVIFIFVLITTIIQTQWVGIEGQWVPILIWIVSQPYVGVFFLPFLLTVIYVCYFVISVARPVTIQKTKSDVRTLFEEEQIVKEEYETIYKNLVTAEVRFKEREKQKAEELKQIHESILKEGVKEDDQEKENTEN